MVPERNVLFGTIERAMMCKTLRLLIDTQHDLRKVPANTSSRD